MDFHQLMQQASAAQTLVQKRHEMKKKVKEDERRKEVEEQREHKRKTSRMLEDMKKASEKRQLEYRGVAQNQLSGKHRTESDRNGSKLTSEMSDSILSSKQSSASNKGKHKISSSTSKPSSSSPSPSSLKSSKTVSSSSSSSSLKYSKPDSSSSSSSSKAISKPKAPVDFKDLMKIAEKKSLQVAEKERMKSVVGDTHAQKGNDGRAAASTGESSVDKKPGAPGRGEREGSPLGKQLLEKSSSRGKRKRTREVMERGEEGERGTASGGSPQDSMNGTRREPMAVDRCRVGGNTRLSPQAGGVPVGRAKPGMGRGERGRGDLNGSGVGRGRGVTRGGGKVGGLPESALLMREKAKRQLEASVRTKQANGSRARPSAETKSFYGGAHAQLSRDERPRFQTRPVAKPYQNSWVSEMSSYMQQVKEEGEEEWEEEEEEEDMDDFVVDDVEDEDYSSAIREIFGYDKRRFRDEQFDDRMMESSFAQQQFEEMRSSRIGWLEDQEDMKREAEQLARKRHKGMPPPARKPGSKGKGLKQTKLSFR